MTQKFIAIGECMVELSSIGDNKFAMGFAGDTFNTSWYLRKLARPELQVAYLSAVGDDEPSHRMTAMMQDAGIQPELTVRAGGHVGLYMISLNKGERSFSYWRDTAAARTLADDLLELPDVSHGDIAFFSGITLAVLPPEGRARLLSVLQDARAKGVRVAFDPNLRPRLWQSSDEMCDWIMKGAAVSDIALPSFEDEEAFFKDADQEATGNRYLTQGCSLVIVKDGPDPVRVMTADTQAMVSPQKVDTVVDTTAAGDAFNAGFIAGMDAGLSPSEAVAIGCRLSAQVIGKPGALVEIDPESFGL